MYSKYSLFYESPKNLEYNAHVQTVCTGPLLREGGKGLGMRLEFHQALPVSVLAVIEGLETRLETICCLTH